MELIQDKNSRKGVIGTVLFHLLLLLLFVQFGMGYQDPPEENQGAMLIDFGNAGGGSSSASSSDSESESSSDNNSSESAEASSSSQENANTQTDVETVEMNASQNNNSETQESVSENLNEALEALNNANNNSNNSNSNSNSNNSSNSNGDGNTNGDNTGPSNGIGFSLGGRGKVSFKKPENPTQEDGTVVVDIWVNRDGKVIKAKPGARGSTTTNPILQKKAEEAAYKAKFKKDPNAPFEQKGTMTFVFILN
jgi:TonB family protein